MLKGFVLSTLNKLPQVKPDLVRTDEGWEDWNMEKLIDSIQNGSSATSPKTLTKIKRIQRERSAITLARKNPTACSAAKTTGGIRVQHLTQSRNGGNSLQQNDCAIIAPAQDTLGKNVAAGGAISVRANTTPAYVIHKGE